ncbi:DNA-3-methyladenine glycosylase I [Nocardioides phosphati]|uniref:DNA-3-methyladenine glycosylase I n=1 Tax=Nocardioides phosphati TaxID=1867775 RepID=A0ABQ2NBH5_9ACTN|nr:DNA-3-methyladenine glycosylase I [Nocardioides phosphati]GGO90230.1 DNA-3-methyladenine glycosylase I [Nocardioides phosphati]
MSDLVLGEDGLLRCRWAGAGEMRAYHDTEWGRPVSGDVAVFERLTLEAFQSGLSWAIILRKRDGFRAAFDGFDPHSIAAYDEVDRARLLADAGIVRNRLKVDATITNARALLDLWDAEGEGALARLAAAHAPDPRPAPASFAEVPGQVPESLALSKALKKRGFVFVGPTTMYALMQALGLANDHLDGCVAREAAGAAPTGESA